MRVSARRCTRSTRTDQGRNGKALHATAKAKGEFGFGAHWAGRGAPLPRAMAADLVSLLQRET